MSLIDAWKAHIDNSIEKALKHESFLDKEILDIKGFSTGVMRRLISNLCHFQKENLTYLEVGLYGGATFCAAINNNPQVIAYGIEDFSQNFGDSDIKGHLHKNIVDFCSTTTNILDSDFFKGNYENIKNVDIFFYDGEHSYESQSKALPHALPMLADEFVFIVDDYDWESVELGTKMGFVWYEKEIEIIQEWHLTDKIPDGPNWHNGVAIFLCRKTA